VLTSPRAYARAMGLDTASSRTVELATPQRLSRIARCAYLAQKAQTSIARLPRRCDCWHETRSTSPPGLRLTRSTCLSQKAAAFHHGCAKHHRCLLAHAPVTLRCRRAHCLGTAHAVRTCAWKAVHAAVYTAVRRARGTHAAPSFAMRHCRWKAAFAAIIIVADIQRLRT